VLVMLAPVFQGAVGAQGQRHCQVVLVMAVESRPVAGDQHQILVDGQAVGRDAAAAMVTAWFLPL